MTPSLADKLFGFHEYTCCCCGVDVFDDSGFCDVCKAALPLNNGKTCALCGAKIEGDHDYCANCKPSDRYFEKIVSSFDYTGVAVTLMRSFKYGNAKYLAGVLAKYMATTFLESGLEVDIVVPAPLSARSLEKRGYNQSLLLAREFCLLTGLPLEEDNLIKIKETVQQEKLTNIQRRNNLSDAFDVVDKTAFVGKKVLVIDDVKTTGTTIDRIAKLLKKCKAAKVYGLTAVSARERLKVNRDKENKDE